MSTSDKPQKISIGFHGGQVLSARIKPDELSRLRGALGSSGFHELGAEDGTVVLDLQLTGRRRADGTPRRWAGACAVRRLRPGSGGQVRSTGRFCAAPGVGIR